MITSVELTQIIVTIELDGVSFTGEFDLMDPEFKDLKFDDTGKEVSPTSALYKDLFNIVLEDYTFECNYEHINN